MKISHASHKLHVARNFQSFFFAIFRKISRIVPANEGIFTFKSENWLWHFSSRAFPFCRRCTHKLCRNHNPKKIYLLLLASFFPAERDSRHESDCTYTYTCNSDVNRILMYAGPPRIIAFKMMTREVVLRALCDRLSGIGYWTRISGK